MDPKDALAPFAMQDDGSEGRRYPEPSHPYRSEFQRDRDRVIHSRAFRRLEYKTQVFVNHIDDHFRTRLTHSIEVSQIARTIAVELRLNPYLAETLALCHDLGHPPFGHLGESILHRLMQEHGGFEHNRQTLRIVEELERRYAAFPGLNLTFESREGIVKHSTKYDLVDTENLDEYRLDDQPPLEVQLIDLADEIAYNHHDLDDGYDSGLLSLDALEENIPRFSAFLQEARQAHPTCRVKILFSEALRRLINHLVSDLIGYTTSRLNELRIESISAVRAFGERLVSFSPATAEENAQLKDFLDESLYQHEQIERMNIKFELVLKLLFREYLNHPKLLPRKYQNRLPEQGTHRVICDYISGMTDRFAIDKYREIFDPNFKFTL